MSNNKKIIFEWPIINGSVSTAYAKCGQKNCRCHTDPKAMHGPYYRWIGNIDGRKTTRTINAKMAKRYRVWIKNYEKLQQIIDKMIKEVIDSEDWGRGDKK